MLKRAFRISVVLGLFLAALGAVGTSWHPSIQDTSGDSNQAQRLVLELVTPAFAAGNQPPTADAGLDRTVAVGETVVLDGSGSTEPEGKAMDFLWTLASVPAGSLAALDDPTAVRPSFTVDLAGDYAVELIATEGPRDRGPGDRCRPPAPHWRQPPAWPAVPRSRQ